VSQTVSPGATATFTVTATGPLLQYLWFFNGNAIGGATNSSLVIANAQAGNVGGYYAIVANPAGAGTSATATLGVGNVAPTITSQPQDVTVVAGGNATFKVVANGTAPLTYQWYLNTNSLLGGATNAQFTLSAVTTNSAGKYRVIVSNNFGSAGSTNATLTVDAAAALPSETNLIGFAAVANVTGGSFGGNTNSVTATNYFSLSNYVRQAAALIIHVQGAITNSEAYCYIYGHNKTIIGDGTNAAFYGDLRVNATNIIIQNLFITCSTNTGFAYMTNDCITIDGGSSGTGKNVWVDHCTLFDATDGSIDITKGADYITVSWCRFAYEPPTPTDIHHYVDLIGSSDSDSAVPFHVTFHHNWYDTNCLERMPSVRFGRVHCFNNYYTCAGNNYCIRTRINAQVLVENNYFQGVQNPWELLTTTGSTGLLKAIGNNVSGTNDFSAGVTWANGWYQGQSLIPGTDTLSDLNPPPYAYTPEAAANVLTDVPTFAGSGKYPYVP
jgi:pectate lyase